MPRKTFAHCLEIGRMVLAVVDVRAAFVAAPVASRNLAVRGAQGDRLNSESLMAPSYSPPLKTPVLHTYFQHLAR
jgi:hypothetical protein